MIALRLCDVATATREQLADELAAAGEWTEDWQTVSMDDLRQRVRRAMNNRLDIIFDSNGDL